MIRLIRVVVLALVVGALVSGPDKVIQTLKNGFSSGRGIAVSSPYMTTLIALIVALSLGFTLGRFRTHLFQNRGEAKLTRALQERFAAPDYHLLNHVTLRLREGTTQVDHILVSRFGVFVIETKDYSGWIFGHRDDRHWTSVHFRAKFRFQNPIHQNDLHIRAVQELLNFLPAGVIKSVVVFTGNAEFRTPIPEGVFSLKTLQAYLERRKTEFMSVNRLQFCVGRLETARLAVTKETDVEHVQRLRRRYGNYR